MIDRIHTFKVHDWVEILPSTLRWAAPGRYKIIRLIPCDSSEPRYCIRSARENHDRVVAECDLVASVEAAAN
jgi:hypothetical protein